MAIATSILLRPETHYAFILNYKAYMLNWNNSNDRYGLRKYYRESHPARSSRIIQLRAGARRQSIRMNGVP
jgi:hypothetical protein